MRRCALEENKIMRFSTEDPHSMGSSINGSEGMGLLIFVVVFVAIYFIFIDEINTVKDRDPAAKSALEVLLLYPGPACPGCFIASAHQLWHMEGPDYSAAGFHRPAIVFSQV